MKNPHTNVPTHVVITPPQVIWCVYMHNALGQSAYIPVISQRRGVMSDL